MSSSAETPPYGVLRLRRLFVRATSNTDRPYLVQEGALRLSVARRGRRAEITVLGELRASTAPEFVDKVRSLVGSGARSVVVNLGGAEVLDQAGVDALSQGLSELRRRGGELVLKSPRAATLRRFHDAGLTDVFSVY